MQLGVISDTHGHVEYARQAVRLLESLEAEHLLHCGDVGSTEVIELFTRWPADYVFGNCDYNHAELAASIQAADQTCHGAFGELTLAGRKIALLHSDDRRRFIETIASEKYDLVCYGHTHAAKIEQHGQTLVVNPGALYRANPHSIAIVDLEQLQATIVAL